MTTPRVLLGKGDGLIRMNRETLTNSSNEYEAKLAELRKEHAEALKFSRGDVSARVNKLQTDITTYTMLVDKTNDDLANLP